MEPHAETSAAGVAVACEDCGGGNVYPRDRCGHVETCRHCGASVDVPSCPPAEPCPLPADPGPKPVAPVADSTAWLWWQVLAAVCLAVLPGLYAALWARYLGPRSARSGFDELFYVVRAIEVIVPLVVIIHLSGDAWSKFGVKPVRWAEDIALGMALCIGATTVLAVMPPWPVTLQDFLPAVPLGRYAGPWGVVGCLLIAAGSLAAGFAEEFAFRGFLLVRLEQLLQSASRAVLVSSVLFASFHCYQSASGVIHAAVFGLVYGAAFCYLRRLWPLCVAHSIHDFIAGVQHAWW